MTADTPNPGSGPPSGAAGGASALPGSGGPLDWGVVLRSPATIWNVLILVALTGVLSILLMWTHKQTLATVGQIMGESHCVRVGFQRIDEAATQADRQAARLKAPWIYTGDKAAFDELRASLENLPRTLADAQTLGDVDATIREQFGLVSPASLEEVRAQREGEGISAAWLARVGRLDAAMRRTPVVDAETFQRQSQAVTPLAEVRVGEAAMTVRAADVVSFAGAEAKLRTLIKEAGFSEPLAEVVLSRVKYRYKPLFKLDQAMTDERARLAAEATQPKLAQYPRGQVMVARGERLTAEKLELLRAEAREYRRSPEDAVVVYAENLSLVGAALLAALGLGAYTATYAGLLWRAPARMGVLAGMVAAALGLGCWVAATEPRLINVAITSPTLLVTAFLAVAYDRRTALAVGSLVGILSCVALDQPAVTIGVALCGVWLAVWLLREFRHRNALIRAGLLTGAALATATLILAGLQRPMTPDALQQAIWEAASAGIGATLVGFITLGLLPTIERVFDVATGMSLIELRDPKQPLLRMLQQRAPGTYNHSLTVASLAEAAAEAIHADGLLAYVGALYHDVGKATKAEFFVENQAGGPNRHDKLPPALSLLVIVGHVKEGLELAREHNLPAVLHHFIESHHGTTLVEYFYHRARKQAEASGKAAEMPQEIEYRYPGPKPRSKEAAILMVCDAAESATRTLSDPTPARIDSLVRAIAHKRLMDGQFDASELTMRDLAVVTETVSRTLAAMNHQRIAYPAGESSGQRSASVPFGAPAAAPGPATISIPAPAAGEVTPPPQVAPGAPQGGSLTGPAPVTPVGLAAARR